MIGRTTTQRMVRRFEDVLERAVAYNPGADLDLLRQAYVFSAREHRNQRRSSGEPYLVHPLEVAYILADLQLDTASIVAGTAARRGRGHADDDRRRRRALRRRRRAHRRRRDEDLEARVREPGRGRGREPAQDDPGHGRRHPGDPGQAGRSTAQHAHPRAPRPRAPRAHRARDARDLRPDRQPAGDGPDQGRARGPGVPAPRARGVPASCRALLESRRKISDRFIDEIQARLESALREPESRPRSPDGSRPPRRSIARCACRRSASTRSTTTSRSA